MDSQLFSTTSSGTRVSGSVVQCSLCSWGFRPSLEKRDYPDFPWIIVEFCGSINRKLPDAQTIVTTYAIHKRAQEVRLYDILEVGHFSHSIAPIFFPF